MRVERINTAHDEVIYVCRRYRIAPGELGSLGIPHGIATKLMDRDLAAGLVLFFGKAGAGKSTAASSFMCERLAKFGGVGWTVENPPELDLQRQHGKGQCYQTEVGDDSLIGPKIRQLMRGTPNIIFIGELRDGRAIAEAITAALSGHLVISTFHAGDLISGIARMARLAQGVEKDMGSLLAEALKVGMHLTLHNYDPEAKPAGLPAEAKGIGTPPRVLTVEPLFLTGPSGDALRTMIRDGEFQQLVSEIDRQKRGLMMRGLP
jgi:Tfp pilus assembly pilus retraction ATPase PilT